MSGDTLWVAVVVASVGCYLLKLAGMSVPAAWVPWQVAQLSPNTD